MKENMIMKKDIRAVTGNNFQLQLWRVDPNNGAYHFNIRETRESFLIPPRRRLTIQNKNGNWIVTATEFLDSFGPENGPNSILNKFRVEIPEMLLWSMDLNENICDNWRDNIDYLLRIVTFMSTGKVLVKVDNAYYIQ